MYRRAEIFTHLLREIWHFNCKLNSDTYHIYPTIPSSFTFNGRQYGTLMSLSYNTDRTLCIQSGTDRVTPQNFVSLWLRFSQCDLEVDVHWMT